MKNVENYIQQKVFSSLFHNVFILLRALWENSNSMACANHTHHWKPGRRSFLIFVYPNTPFVYILNRAAVRIAKSTPRTRPISWAKTNLSGFSVMPFLPHTSNQFTAWKKLSSILEDHKIVSSMHLLFWGMSATISS